MVAPHVAVVFCVENVETIAPRNLGLVHGLIGLAQGIGIDVFGLREKVTPRLAETCKSNSPTRTMICAAASKDGSAAIGRRDAESFKSASTATNSSPQCGPGCRHITQFGACAAPGDQQLVARIMPVVVIDGFESVQIQKNHRQVLVAAQRLRHGLVHAICQQHAVGQARERVEVGDALQLRCQFF